MTTNSDFHSTTRPSTAATTLGSALTTKKSPVSTKTKALPAQKAGNQAYIRAMPPLSGYQNICDFIACVTNALVIDAIAACDAKRLFAAAKIAITAVRSEPAPPKTSRPELSKGGQELLKAARELTNCSQQIPGEADAKGV